MQPFTTLTGIAAPLPILNVDTDMIIPKQFLKTIERTGLGKNLFFEMRYDVAGNVVTDFVLHQPAYKAAQILVTGANFGCGSSREHAPWALLDYGIRCVIAPSFADIFFNNCFKNGILPIVLPEDVVKNLIQQVQDKPGAALTIDLPNQTITDTKGQSIAFTVDSFRKHCLLGGLDDIGLTLQHKTSINQFEQRDQAQKPWLWQSVNA